MKRKILIVGTPGIGKTTVMQKLYSSLAGKNKIVGFVTREVRKEKTRIGFDAITFPEKQIFPVARFARTIPPDIRVGKYKVDVKQVDSLVRFLEQLSRKTEPDLWMIDEIGKMECLSDLFCNWLLGILEQDVPVIATVASHGTAFIESIKKRPDVDLFHLNLDSRRTALKDLMQKIKSIL